MNRNKIFLVLLHGIFLVSVLMLSTPVYAEWGNIKDCGEDGFLDCAADSQCSPYVDGVFCYFGDLGGDSGDGNCKKGGGGLHDITCDCSYRVRSNKTKHCDLTCDSNNTYPDPFCGDSGWNCDRKCNSSCGSIDSECEGENLGWIGCDYGNDNRVDVCVENCQITEGMCWYDPTGFTTCNSGPKCNWIDPDGSNPTCDYNGDGTVGDGICNSTCHCVPNHECYPLGDLNCTGGTVYNCTDSDGDGDLEWEATSINKWCKYNSVKKCGGPGGNSILNDENCNNDDCTSGNDECDCWTQHCSESGNTADCYHDTDGFYCRGSGHTDTCDDKCPPIKNKLHLNGIKRCNGDNSDCHWEPCEYDVYECNQTTHWSTCAADSSTPKYCDSGSGDEAYYCTDAGSGRVWTTNIPGNETNIPGTGYDNCGDGWDNDCNNGCDTDGCNIDGHPLSGATYCYDMPTAGFTYSPTNPNSFEEITFTDESDVPSGRSIDTLTWEFSHSGTEPPSNLDYDVTCYRPAPNVFYCIVNDEDGCWQTIENLTTTFSSSSLQDAIVNLAYYCNGTYDVPGTITQNAVTGFYPDSGTHKVNLTIEDNLGFTDSVEKTVGSGCYDRKCGGVQVRICPDWV